MPVSAVVEGDATIIGEREHVKIEIDYSDFIEVRQGYCNTLTILYCWADFHAKRVLLSA